MPAPLVYFNNRFLPQSQAALPWHDAGFIMGATVTDLCRTFRHKLFRWPDHLERFRAACRLAQMESLVTLDQITAHAHELVEHNAKVLTPEQDLALVMFATPGPIGYYLGEDGGLGDGTISFGMHTFPLPFARYRKWLERGVSLMVPTIRQAGNIDPHIKMRSRLHWWLAHCEAQRFEPGSVAVLLDVDGYITETAGANVLLVKQGEVVSPPRERILEGISRRVVMELCAKLAIPFAERPLTIEDFNKADEVFLTNTSYCLMGVSGFQGRAVPWPGEICRRLMRAWSESVGVDIVEQVLS